MKSIKCVVSAINGNGEPDFYFVKVVGTVEQFENGNHYVAAKDQCEKDGYEPLIAYDENDVAWKAFSRNAFEWKSATIVKL